MPGPGRPVARAAALALVALLAAVVAPPARTVAQPLRLGFADSLFYADDSAMRSEWLGRAATTGASVVRVDVDWAGIAPPTRPAGFDAADPASPGYRWTTLDEVVREADADGLAVLFTVFRAPRWAEGGKAPRRAVPGSWEPSRTAFGEFGRALARRYGGDFPDPTDPTRELPEVKYFEAWNEPNLEEFLAPQWRGGENRAANVYRGLVNSFYAGIKEAAPGAEILAGSLAPFGDEPGGSRTRPVLFLRDLFCLRGAALRKVSCPEPVHLDILSAHPIAVGAPTRSATSPLDATTPDLDRLTKVLRAAERTKRALPAGRKHLWVTEFWSDTDPPDPTGLPLGRQARWYQEDLYLFWRQGAEVAIALQLRDAPRGKGYATSYQSGLYFLDGHPKPSATAFRFPFVARRSGPARVGFWGVAPTRGRVRIEVYRAGTWGTVGSVATAGAPRPFTGSLRLRRPARLRAVIGARASLPWTQG